MGLDVSIIIDHFGSLLGMDAVNALIEKIKGEAKPPNNQLTKPDTTGELPPVTTTAGQLFPKTEGRYPGRITVGMATYDDFDGVYFTIQSMRINNPELAGEIEFIIVDNNPTGTAAFHLHQISLSIPHVRYIPAGEWSGTAIKNKIFEEATNSIVLVVDGHVLVAPNAVTRLVVNLEQNPQCKDIIHGPLYNDDLRHIGTHLEPKWSGGSFGTWGWDPRGTDPDAPPFEITAMGLGLFACRREFWPGYNPMWRGYGGEEGYIQDKIRQRGGRALCYPFLRWAHRAMRPHGVPYPNRWEDHFRNAYIGYVELGEDTAELENHFSERIGKEIVTSFVTVIKAELAQYYASPA